MIIGPKNLTLDLLNQKFYPVKISYKNENLSPDLIYLPICQHSTELYFYVFPDDSNKVANMVSNDKLVYFKVDLDTKQVSNDHSVNITNDQETILYFRDFLFTNKIPEITQMILDKLDLIKKANQTHFKKKARKLYYQHFYKDEVTNTKLERSIKKW